VAAAPLETAPGTPRETAALPAEASRAVAANPEGSVRAVLARYEAAYSGLDAAAAGAVWPSVDRRALARAFEGLTAQTVDLGRCEVRVTGASARAECSGRAEWTPRVGGGTRSAARRWQFDLKAAGNDWVIVSAETR
jgi:hypothetical protein